MCQDLGVVVSPVGRKFWPKPTYQSKKTHSSCATQYSQSALWIYWAAKHYTFIAKQFDYHTNVVKLLIDSTVNKGLNTTLE